MDLTINIVKIILSLGDPVDIKVVLKFIVTLVLQMHLKINLECDNVISFL